MLFRNPDDRAMFVKRGLSKANSPLILGSGVNDDKFRPVVTRSNFRKTGRPLVIGCVAACYATKASQN